MPVALTESTMIAANGRLDETGSVAGSPLELILTEGNRHESLAAAAEARVSP